MQKYELLSLISLLKSKLFSKPLTLLGMALGFFGAILLALSVEITDPWIPPPALNHITIIPEFFSSGVVLLAGGFVLQAAGVIWDK